MGRCFNNWKLLGCETGAQSSFPYPESHCKGEDVSKPTAAGRLGFAAIETNGTKGERSHPFPFIVMYFSQLMV